METALINASKAQDYIKGRLGKAPSPGLMQLMTDLLEIGLPVRVHDQTGQPAGSYQVRRDGIELRLADGPFSEGVIAHEAVGALLETRGWPKLFGEIPAAGTRHYLERLVNMLDHGCGIALQREYGLEWEAYEQAQITNQWRRIVNLNKQKEELSAKGMSATDKVGYSLDIALAAVDQRWRIGSTPVPYLQAMTTFPDAKALYDQMMQAAPEGLPQTGWPLRRLLKALLDIVDGYLEKTTGARPLNQASRFVPSLHPEDAQRTVGQVLTIVETPLSDQPGAEYDIRAISPRDGLAFGYREAFQTPAIAKKQLESLGQENFANFIRAKVPHAILIWRPTGE